MTKAYIKDDFVNLLQYRQWVNRSFNQLQYNKSHLSYFGEQYIEKLAQQRPNWFGSGTNYTELLAGITQYKDPDLIETIYQKVTDKLDLNSYQKIPKRTIVFNPFGLGMFSFDRAAMGLYRIPEYYSPSLGRCVDKSAVSLIKDRYVLTSDQSSIIERWEQRADGKPKLRTSVKKVFAYYPKMNKEKLAVEMYISCGGHNSITADKLLYSGIAAIIVAQLLVQANIPVRIVIAMGSFPDSTEATAFASLIPVKNFDDPLDTNLLATLSSDPRFFRYEGFKGIISSYEHFKQVCPSSLGLGFTNDTLKTVIEQSTYTRNAPTSNNRLYFGWTFSERDCVQAVNDALAELNKKFTAL